MYRTALVVQKIEGAIAPAIIRRFIFAMELLKGAEQVPIKGVGGTVDSRHSRVSSIVSCQL